MDDLNELEEKPTEEKVMAFLEGVAYPIKKQDIVEWATQQRADDTVLAVLEKLPEQTYDKQEDIADALAEFELTKTEEIVD